MVFFPRIRGLFQLGRWSIFAFSTLCLIIIEVIYYWLDERMISDLEELSLVIGLALQIVIGILIAQGNWIITSASTSQPLKMHRLLKQHLVDVSGLNEISDVLLRVAHTFVPLIGASFIKYDKKSGRYVLIDEWSLDGRALPIPTQVREAMPRHNNSSINFVEQGPETGFFIPGINSKQPQGSEQLSMFCLPRPHGDSHITLLSLFFLPGASFSKSQMALLNEFALETGLAIERAQMRQQIFSQDTAKKAENDRIARYLHDTLGHNLAYLRLKLDQLSGDDAFQDIVLIQQEIERMRDIADLAYEQMRNSLSDLREEPIPELAAAIEEYATATSDRAGFQVRFQSEGKSRSIPAHLQRQILYIFREVLRNIEKHAYARLVRIRMVWSEDNLTLVVQDDGRGFDVESARKQPGHYGLKIIEECTQEINGRLMLSSKANTGTKIILRLSFNQQPSERAYSPVSVS